MKKILIISTLICAFGLCVMGKTQSEIISDYNANIASGLSWWASAKKTYEQNSSDIATLFAQWKQLESSKFGYWEKGFEKFNFSDEDKKNQAVLRGIFSIYLAENPAEVKNTPKRVAITTSPETYLSNVTTDNPNEYTELKAADFVLDGVKLPMYAILNLAASAGDKQYFESVSVVEGMDAEEIYLKNIVPILLESSDILAAKSKANEIENILIKKGKSETASGVMIRAVNKALTSRLVDSKIMGN